MKIYPIQTGTVQIKTNQRAGKGIGPLRKLNMFIDPKWTEPLPIYAWVIDHSEGLIVVDTGDTAKTMTKGYFPFWHPYYRFGVRMNIQPEEEIGPQLHKMGIRPNDVKQVILTHFHTDHAGGLHHFPNSEILANWRDYRLARGFSGKLQGYLPHKWPEWFTPKAISFRPREVGPFNESYNVTKNGDIIIVPTPGHTPGHISVIAFVDDLAYFLAGDTSYTLRLLLEERVDGVSPNESIARHTLQKIFSFALEQPVVYLPSHDRQSAERLKNNTTIGGTSIYSEASIFNAIVEISP